MAPLPLGGSCARAARTLLTLPWPWPLVMKLVTPMLSRPLPFSRRSLLPCGDEVLDGVLEGVREVKVDMPLAWVAGAIPVALAGRLMCRL